LFVGSGVRTGDYGASPKSSLLVNQGNGQFKDETQKWFGSDFDCGMVNTADWADLDGDGQAELLISGDWQGVRVFKISSDNKLVESQISGLEFSAGWINALKLADLNGDGRLDILVGNLGLNSKLKASKEKPVWLYHHDFDGNGQADPLIFHHMGENLVPFGTRDDLIRQIPGIKRKHSSYAEYAKITRPEDLFPKEEIEKARKLAAYEFRSGVYFQKADGSFEFIPFPAAAQWSPVMAIEVEGNSGTVVLAGNFSGFRVDLGNSMNLAPVAYRWTLDHWEKVPMETSGSEKSEIRSLRKITINCEILSIGAQNNGSPVWIR